MKLNFCVLCGSEKELHHHHVIPKVKGGTDDEDNFMTLCEKHHEVVHNIQQCDNFFELARIGRANAMKRGVRMGPKPKYEHLVPDIKILRQKYRDDPTKGLGTVVKELNKKYNIGIDRSAIQRLVRKFDL